MRTHKWIFGIILSILLLTFSITQATIYCVSPNGNDNNNGLNWVSAFKTINKGIDTAINGDIVKVGEGIYYETVNFDGKAITLTGTDPNNWDVVAATVINASGYYYGVRFNLGEGANSILTGLTICRSSIGVSCGNSSGPKIEKCIIEKVNSTGITIVPGTSPKIQNNIIRNCAYIGIQGGSSGAIVIKNNWVYNMLTGISLSGSPAAEIRNNTIVGCTGAGITGSGTTPVVSNCIVWSCGDDLSGYSAIYSCISDGDNGTGNISSDPCFINSFDFIDYVYGGTTTTINVPNANLYQVGDVIEYNNDGIARTLTEVNTSSNVITFANDPLSANPQMLFLLSNWGPGVTDVNEDFHLLPTSLCLDVGDSSGSYTGQTDIDGGNRVINISGKGDGNVDVDMGADELAAAYNQTQGTWYSSIQSAINDSSNGDEIVVYPGIYYENICIWFTNKTITVRGSDPDNWEIVKKTIIDGSRNIYYAHVAAISSGSVLEGLTARNDYSGGEYAGVLCNGTIRKCIVENNGYGIVCESGYPTTVEKNIIRNNLLTGVFSYSSPIIRNNIIFSNGYGIQTGSSSIVISNTVVGSTVGITGIGNYALPIRNCIVWANEYNLDNCSATYSCFDGGTGTNISSDPKFFYSSDWKDYRNFHITSGSPCINAGAPGSDSYYSGAKDIDNENREWNGRIDIGADEIPNKCLWFYDSHYPGSEFWAKFANIDKLNSSAHTQLTVALWVKMRGSYDLVELLMRLDNYGYSSWCISINEEGGSGFGRYCSGGYSDIIYLDYFDPNNLYVSNSWNLIVVTTDDSCSKFYINGNLRGTSQGGQSYSVGGDIIFSRIVEHQSEHYIDGLFISQSEAKDANWVQDVWRNGVGRKFSDADLVGLSGYANFDELPFCLRVHDTSGFTNYTGTLGKDVHSVSGGIE